MASDLRPESQARQGARWVAVAALLWSSGGLFIKLAPASGLGVAWGRAVVTTLFYLVVMRPDLRRARATTGLAYAAMIVTFVSATKLTTAANAIFLQYTGPAYVLVLGPWLLKEPLRKLDIACVAASAMGMALFFFDQSSPGQTVGNLVGAVSGLCFALAVIGMRRDAAAEHRDSLPSITLGNLLTVLLLLPFVWKEIPQMAVPRSIGIMAYLGIVQMGISYLAFGKGLRTLPAAAASLVAMLEPVLNPLWVFLGTGERPGRWALIGGAVVVGAVALRTMLADSNTRQAEPA